MHQIKKLIAEPIIFAIHKLDTTRHKALHQPAFISYVELAHVHK